MLTAMFEADVNGGRTKEPDLLDVMETKCDEYVCDDSVER